MMKKNYLLFRLYGHMSSWGDIAVGDIRPSFHYPSKSAIIGLIAASMGIRRDKHEKHSELAKLIFSVRIDAPGVPIEDYHTVQTPYEQTIKNNRTNACWTRIDEIKAIKNRIKTENSGDARKQAGAITSRRTYLCDAVYTIALCEDETKVINWHVLEISGLQDVGQFLLKPEFITYLGRKSCPLSLPMEPQIIHAVNCKEAFRQTKFTKYNELTLIFSEKDNIRYYSEEKIEYSQMKLVRRDQPVNRMTWQFTERDEYYFSE